MKQVQKNWLEWSVFTVGLLLVVLLVGYLIYEAVTLGNEPPIIQVEFGTIEQQDGRYLVQLTIYNIGDKTAEEVGIEVMLMNGDREVERAGITIDYLPRHSTRQGWITFQTDPRSVDAMEPHVLGYRVP